MRLCGIISRFQLLSPGTGQVAHALLTRSPLSINMFSAEASNGVYTPFDLHVLGTPPAFILSQDRTLTFKSVSMFAGAKPVESVSPCKRIYLGLIKDLVVCLI